MTAPIPIRTPDIGLEDADDNALYDARKAALGAGGVILSPHMSAAILRGEARLKAVLEKLGNTDREPNTA